MDDLRLYFELLRQGPAALRQIFAGEPILDDPQFGCILGENSLKGYAEKTIAWIDESEATVIAATDTREISVVEFVVNLVRDGRQVPLPVAIAGERGGGAFTAVRIYYSMWPLLGHHLIRRPLLSEKVPLPIPDVVGRYHDALTRGDLAGIMAVFEDDAYAREPSGGKYVYQGKERLREFYGMLFANGGGIRLEHCTLTDDGVRAALEYNAIDWGKTAMPPQAGIAVYERGKSGLLQAARIYDDVDPPVRG